MAQVGPRLWLDEGVLSGVRCVPAWSRSGADEALARLSFDRAHPVGDAPHTVEEPVGWLAASRPGALSQ